jgi:MFS family permease
MLAPSVPDTHPTKFTKDQIRSSLSASTLDGIFATLFSNLTGGVLLSNFLVELRATPIQIGLLAALPMLANLLQPLGADWADRTTSRRHYNLWVYGISRLLWLPLGIAIIVYSWHPDHPRQMIFATLAVVLVTHVFGALGSASWLSWLAVLIPRQLRGRYFGFRNSLLSLTSLIVLPLSGVATAQWIGGTIQGFGVMVVLATIAGLFSLAFQFRIADVNPQNNLLNTSNSQPENNTTSNLITPPESFNSVDSSILIDIRDSSPAIYSNPFQDSRFLLFLLYFSFWAFGVNLSNPFFNLYLLDSLGLNVSWVTLYNSLGAGANLIMLLFWGRLADRIGNRPILLLDGVLVAIIPLFWLGTNTATLSIWLWFPLLHLIGGGTGAAIDLCINNLQLAIAPMQHHTKYFAITAALGGVSGALGALTGGWLADLSESHNMTQLFALSTVMRLVALLPLVWLPAPQERSVRQMLEQLVLKSATALIPLRIPPTRVE